MSTLPMSLFWSRIDTAGADHAMVDDHRGLRARGVALAATPLPYTCRYEVMTDEAWATSRVEVTVEGANWVRSVKLERAIGRWRVVTAEQGDLSRELVANGHRPVGLPGLDDPDQLVGAVDADLATAPLFNTLPIRRLRLLDAEPGTTHRITVAWVAVPSLVVEPSKQRYTALGGNQVSYRSGSVTTQLALDWDGYLTYYPELAKRLGDEDDQGRPAASSNNPSGS